MSRIELSQRYFRPSTFAERMEIDFLFANGGLGDFICWLPAILWIAKECPQVRGTLVVPDFFREIADNVLGSLPHWRVKKKSDYRGSETFKASVSPTVNAAGAHLVDIGFQYFCNLSTAPDGYSVYPNLDLTRITPLALPEPYAVVTPAATSSLRAMPAKAFNGICEHLRSRGVTPVFLGKAEVTAGYNSSVQPDYRFQGGVDLRDKTSILEAAKIIEGAKLVVGLDNGLLHLAGCTSTPIIFGYNVASPEHRRPRRMAGEIYELFPNETDLPCVFCQSRMRFLPGHDFSRCLYRDLACLKELEDPGPWCELIDSAIGQKIENGGSGIILS